MSYHYAREVIASGMVKFHHIGGHLNPADILSKHWGYQAVWPMLQTCLFWEGDTGKLLEMESSPEPRKGSDNSSVGEGTLDDPIPN